MSEIATDVSIKELEKTATQVRRDVLRMVHGCGSGHPGGALGCADYFVALYFKVMKHDAGFNMDGVGEDLFYLSNGHICAGLYATLARRGYFPVSELKTHRKIDSRLQGHPTPHEHLEGVRIASGSLGQGLSVAVGSALTKKLNNDNRNVYVLMGDGEQQEGQVWEAAMYAGSKGVDNLIAAIDYNGQQIDGSIKEVMDLLDLRAKYESFGWEVIDVEGNDMEKLLEGFELAQSKAGKGKPVMMLMKTDMGYPIDFMVGTHKWHGVAPNDEQLEQALSQLEETLGDY